MTESVFSRIEATLGKGAPRLVYQPLIRYPTRDIFGFEALFRWHQESSGDLCPPGTLFDKLEPAHTSELFFWVLDRAVQEVQGLATWTKFDGFLSVNMEADQLGDPDLFEHVSRALQTYAMPPERLVLEVTERRAVPDFPTTQRNMRLLARHRIMLAMDDFGDGFASIEYVRKLRPAYLKLSGTMVRNVPHDAFNVAVVRLAIGFARETGATLIVEGVEWAEQAKALHELGVRSMQGFLFGMPAPIDDWAGRLSSRPLPNQDAQS